MHKICHCKHLICRDKHLVRRCAHKVCRCEHLICRKKIFENAKKCTIIQTKEYNKMTKITNVKSCFVLFTLASGLVHSFEIQLWTVRMFRSVILNISLKVELFLIILNIVSLASSLTLTWVLLASFTRITIFF